MHHTSSLSALAAARFERFQAMKQQQDTKQKQSELSNNTSIEVPAAIQQLNTGSEYWVNLKTKRYKKLIRDGHLADLLELTALALTKSKPENWFAKVASVKAWERTLDFLKKRHAVLRRAEQVAERIGTNMAEKMKKFVYKQLWAGKSVERHAVAAQELGENRHKLFAWLCRQEGQGTTAQHTA